MRGEQTVAAAAAVTYQYQNPHRIIHKDQCSNGNKRRSKDFITDGHGTKSEEILTRRFGDTRGGGGRKKKEKKSVF